MCSYVHRTKPKETHTKKETIVSCLEEIINQCQKKLKKKKKTYMEVKRKREIEKVCVCVCACSICGPFLFVTLHHWDYGSWVLFSSLISCE